MACMGYLYGVQELYAVARFTAIAWPTATARFTALSTRKGREGAGVYRRAMPGLADRAVRPLANAVKRR